MYMHLKFTLLTCFFHFLWQAQQLEQELSQMVSKTTILEKQIHKSDLRQTELQDKSQQLATVRNQLEGEKLQRYHTVHIIFF